MSETNRLFFVKALYANRESAILGMDQKQPDKERRDEEDEI